MLAAVQAFHDKHRFAETGGEEMIYRVALMAEELGEISECVTKGKSREALAEELADLMILLIGTASLAGLISKQHFGPKWSALKSGRHASSMAASASPSSLTRIRRERLIDTSNAVGHSRSRRRDQCRFQRLHQVPCRMEPLPGSLAAIAALTNAGRTVAVATNQSGVARGLFDIDTLNRIHSLMSAQVVAMVDASTLLFFARTDRISTVPVASHAPACCCVGASLRCVSARRSCRRRLFTRLGGGVER